MNKPNGGDASSSAPRQQLPAEPSLEHLRKQAKALAKQPPGLKLTAAQHQLAREYGCKNWAELTRLVRALRVSPGEAPTAMDHQLVEAIQLRDLEKTNALLIAGADPNRRASDGTVPLHHAARFGPPAVVQLLLSRGARNWIPDNGGRLPVDYAKEGEPSADKAAIVELFTTPRMEAAEFRDAVAAMTTGNLPALQRLLQDHPDLAQARAEESGEFAGPYFSRPYLLEFIPENPKRTGQLPPNICQIAQAIIDAGAPQEAIHRTLELAASGSVPRECGLQEELIEKLVHNGGDPTRGLDAAITHGEGTAVQTLLRLGAEPSLIAAAGLGREAQVRSMLSRSAAPEELGRAADAAIRGGHLDCLRALLDAGLSPAAKIPGHPYSPTLLHQAAFSGQAAIVELLLEEGASPNETDTQFRGTPADWARHGGHSQLEVRLSEAAAAANHPRPKRLGD